MAQSVKLKDGSYIDTEGIYDVTQGKTQKDINSAQSEVNATIPAIVLSFIKSAQIRVQSDRVWLDIYTESDGSYHIGFDYLSTSNSKAVLDRVDASGNYNRVWAITS